MFSASRALASSTPSAHPGVGARALAALRRDPVVYLLLAGCVGALVYFFGFFSIFVNGTQSAAIWAREAWNPVSNQEHSWLVLPISAGLFWYHSARLRETPSEPWNPGIFIVAFGIACFVLGARALQPRISIFAFPVILIGIIAYLWGLRAARILLFPCAFLLFMIPIGGLVQGTVSLQILVSSVCNVMASLVGMKIEASGTTIRSLDGSFNFEIAEGCSGIRSLMAMMMLTALFVHFTQREWWKKGVIFAGSLVFAVIGNIGRIFTVILVAKFLNPRIAGGIYHDYSGFIFFPVAVLAMASFAHLLNLDWTAIFAGTPEPAQAAAPAESDPPGTQGKSSGGSGPVSYDY